jgi:AraC-like DNA-binding protein
MGLTAGQLSRICREVLGMSALDVINARLVHEAQRELVYSVGSVKQLAAELGFRRRRVLQPLLQAPHRPEPARLPRPGAGAAGHPTAP